MTSTPETQTLPDPATQNIIESQDTTGILAQVEILLEEAARRCARATTPGDGAPRHQMLGEAIELIQYVESTL
jgi:hypothetical protein